MIKNGRPQGGMPAFPQLSPRTFTIFDQFLKLQIELAANRGTYGPTYGGLRNQITGDAAKRAGILPGELRRSAIRRRAIWRKSARNSRKRRTLQARFLWPAHSRPGARDRHHEVRGKRLRELW